MPLFLTWGGVTPLSETKNPVSRISGLTNLKLLSEASPRCADVSVYRYVVFGNRCVVVPAHRCVFLVYRCVHLQVCMSFMLSQRLQRT